MKIKVGFLNLQLFKNYLAAISVISVFVSFFTIVYQLPENNDDLRIAVAIGMIVLLIFIWLIMWVRANIQREANLIFNNSTLEVKVGDIFAEQGLKVIPFNEFFDTQVDERIISSNTLNGQFVKNLSTPANIDKAVSDEPLLKNKVIEHNVNRTSGKTTRYELGSICQLQDYLLLAFSKFDDANRAHLSMRDYTTCLLNFWNQVDIIYAGRSISIPLMGSGLTRLDNYNTISEQELLEIIIWSFRVSRVKFTYPSKVSIIIHESLVDKINFYKLSEC